MQGVFSWGKQCTDLRTFALIVYAHPYCAHNSCRNAMVHMYVLKRESWLKTALFKVVKWTLCVKLFQSFKVNNSLAGLNTGHSVSALLAFKFPVCHHVLFFNCFLAKNPLKVIGMCQ